VKFEESTTNRGELCHNMRRYLPTACKLLKREVLAKR
jgi:hypothetical protein